MDSAILIYGMIGMTIVAKGASCVVWVKETGPENLYIPKGVVGIVLSWVFSPVLSGLFAVLLFFTVRTLIVVGISTGLIMAQGINSPIAGAPWDQDSIQGRFLSDKCDAFVADKHDWLGYSDCTLSTNMPSP